MPEGSHEFPPLDPSKFQDPLITATGETRAWVDMAALETLWFNTGSLCNIACDHCYMHSSPTNDDLAYLKVDEVRNFLDEITAQNLPTTQIGFTGGEPFMNADIIAMVDLALERGFQVLVLSNAMKPLWNRRHGLLDLIAAHGTKNLTLRVSIDHPTVAIHEQERGAGTWAPMERGVKWLRDHGFTLEVAGRSQWHEHEDEARAAYRSLFASWDLSLDAADPACLTLFPEMDETRDVPEITTKCWALLGVRPDAQMCATSRMVARRKGEAKPQVVPCTLLPYDPAFDMGETLRESLASVRLNHPHCAKFCVLGGASCSAQGL